MTDTHCHIHHCKDPDLVFQNAINQGVKKFINIFDCTEEKKNYEFYSHESFFKSYGVHPLNVEKISQEEAEKTMEEWSPLVCAYGETGIDLYRSNNKSLQMEFLDLHARMCEKYNKTIVIHARNCDYKELLESIKKYHIRKVLHCFTGNSEEAKICLDYDCWISFSGILTFNKSDYLRDILKFCPENKILLETDSPFLAPEPFRGKENQPSFIEKTYLKASEIRKLSMEQIITIVNKNCKDAFLV